MIDGMSSERTEALRGYLLLAWAPAIVPNTIEAFGGPEGDWWRALRLGLSSLFVLALVAFVASRLADRRRR
jgi:hypothetical protein